VLRRDDRVDRGVELRPVTDHGLAGRAGNADHAGDLHGHRLPPTWSGRIPPDPARELRDARRDEDRGGDESVGCGARR
jgi:hypothetical protein